MKETAWSAGGRREGGGADWGERREKMAHSTHAKKQLVYFKVIDAIFSHDLIFNSERRAMTANLRKRFK